VSITFLPYLPQSLVCTLWGYYKIVTVAIYIYIGPMKFACDSVKDQQQLSSVVNK
jgi:hypothetical protein